MRVSSYAVARPNYYDRVTATKGSVYDATVAPAGSTQRWVYTVGAGLKSYVEVALVQQTRATAATVAGVSSAYIAATTSDASVPLVCFVNGIQTTVGVQAQSSVASIALLSAGDALKGITADASTGGTVYFTVSAKYTEFSA